MSKPADEQRLLQAMNEHAGRAFPGGSDVWPGVAERLRVASRPRSAVPMQVGLATGLLVLLLVGAFIGLPLLQPVAIPTPLPGVADVPSATAQTVAQATVTVRPALDSITQTVNGYQLVIRPVIADANEIVLRYSLRGPDGKWFGGLLLDSDQPGEPPALRDDAGNEYPFISITMPSEDVNDSDSYPDSSAGRDILRFDAGGRLRTGPLRLHLSVDVLRRASEDAPQDPATGQERQAPRGLEMVAGPFDFSFTMPVDSRLKVAEIHQKVVVNNFEVELQRAQVSPSGMRLELRVGQDGDILYPGKMRVAIPHNSGLDWYHVGIPDNNVFIVTFHSSDWRLNQTLDYSGPWTLQVQTLEVGVNELKGPWAFTWAFTSHVPQMSAELTVKSGSNGAWVQVHADGKPVQQGTLAAGTTLSVTATQTIRIRTGRADLVSVKINGEDKGLMGNARQMIVTKEWDSSGRETTVAVASPPMTVEVAVRTGNADAWLLVQADGQVVYRQTMAAGSRETFTATQTIRIRTGRADLVSVKINGEDKGPLGGTNQMIVTKEWDSSGKETIIR